MADVPSRGRSPSVTPPQPPPPPPLLLLHHFEPHLFFHPTPRRPSSCKKASCGLFLAFLLVLLTSSTPCGIYRVAPDASRISRWLPTGPRTLPPWLAPFLPSLSLSPPPPFSLADTPSPPVLSQRQKRCCDCSHSVFWFLPLSSTPPPLLLLLLCLSFHTLFSQVQYLFKMTAWMKCTLQFALGLKRKRDHRIQQTFV